MGLKIFIGKDHESLFSLISCDCNAELFAENFFFFFSFEKKKKIMVKLVNASYTVFKTRT